MWNSPRTSERIQTITDRSGHAPRDLSIGGFWVFRLCSNHIEKVVNRRKAGGILNPTPRAIWSVVGRPELLDDKTAALEGETVAVATFIDSVEDGLAVSVREVDALTVAELESVVIVPAAHVYQFNSIHPPHRMSN